MNLTPIPKKKTKAKKLHPTTSDEIDNPNSPVIINKTGFIVKNLKMKSPDPGFS